MAKKKPPKINYKIIDYLIEDLKKHTFTADQYLFDDKVISSRYAESLIKNAFKAGLGRYRADEKLLYFLYDYDEELIKLKTKLDKYLNVLEDKPVVEEQSYSELLSELGIEDPYAYNYD